MTNRVQLEPSAANSKATPEELAEVPSIDSRQDYLEALHDPDYATSPKYRELLSFAVAKSDHRVIFGDGLPSTPQPESEQASAAMIEARADTMAQMFRDPRYQTSAAYRWEVQQRVAELTKNDHNRVAENALNAGGGTTSVSLPTSPHQAADIRTTAFARVLLPPTKTVGDALSVKKKNSEQ
ncbi:hypothetical protein [Candidatus Nitrospira nitrificans]|uniref:Uncharacterized protein n=1 Tax=Candidatus Nitrospira nitrificans TaxID=1742973 RepID=A0A0S4LIZ3_9BACT|nr:hypothetical protein [Candidatus Nitrospira nitrificans]CUS37532.1 hypothetical protein COMA2_30319 [Candidatus Nitrospira nitrificans]